ncbi:MAG: type II toxin-antitoxin system VapC family toxin [Planctomycetes bacterium]|nr:type II toxin-antitoxin system VapC family toxin [Planctomycetota bacterium]
MPENAVFLDTNGWFALLNSADTFHAEALSLWQEIVNTNAVVFLTDWVAVETGNGLARTSGRRNFTNAFRLLRSSPKARLICMDEELLDRALFLYTSRPDKFWGLVDCGSFVVMKDHRIKRAFTNDRHFRQAGFNCLLPIS